MFGIWAAVKATTSRLGSLRKAALKSWKSRPAAPMMTTLRRGMVRSVRRRVYALDDVQEQRVFRRLVPGQGRQEGARPADPPARRGRAPVAPSQVPAQPVELDEEASVLLAKPSPGRSGGGAGLFDRFEEPPLLLAA